MTLKRYFVLKGWDIAYFARVYYYYHYYFKTWHSLIQCSFIFHNPHHRHYISIRQIVCMFMLCIAYWYVSLCCSTDLQWYVKIATPTALSASALRPGICQSVAQLLYRIAPCIICAGTCPCFSPTRLSGRKFSGAGLLWGKSALRRVQSSNDACVGVESQVRWMQDGAPIVFPPLLAG